MLYIDTSTSRHNGMVTSARTKREALRERASMNASHPYKRMDYASHDVIRKVTKSIKKA